MPIAELFQFNGLNTLTSPYLIEDAELTELKNADLSLKGAIKKGLGKVKLVSTSLGSGRISGLYRFYRKSTETEYLVIAWGTKVYYLKNGVWTQITTVSNLTNHYFLTAFNDWLYIFNGTDTPKKWDGTSVYNVGIAASTTPATFNDDISGNLFEDREYSIVYTYYSSSQGLESSCSNPSSSVTASSSKGIKWNLTKSSDPQVDKIKVYRTLGNQSEYFYEGITNNVTSPTFNSTIADVSLGTIKAPTDNTAPLSSFAIPCYHLGRIFVSSGFKVYYSKPYPYHEHYPSDYYVVTPNGENVTGLVSLMTNVYIFTENSISILNTPTTGNPIQAWNCYQVEGRIGCIAPRSIVSVNGLVFFLAKDGVYVFDGRLVKRISYPLIDLSNINTSYQHLSAAFYYDGKYYLSIPEGTSTVPNVTYELNLDGLTWNKYTNKGFSAYELYQGNVLGSSPSSGLVYKAFYGNDDDGSNITLEFYTKPFELTKYPIYKSFKKLHLLMDGTGTVTIKITIDGNETLVENIAIDGFGFYQFPQLIHRGRTIQIGLKHTSKTAFTFYGFALEFTEDIKK